jgi:hypothetical protein
MIDWCDAPEPLLEVDEMQDGVDNNNCRQLQQEAFTIRAAHPRDSLSPSDVLLSSPL